MGKRLNIEWENPYRRLSEVELLERIRRGDERAEEHLVVTYQPGLQTYVTFLLRDKPDQLGLIGDYVQDALLTLLFKARKLGAAALKDENRPIGGWLNRTAGYLLCNATRSDRFNDRDQWQQDENDDELPTSKVYTLEDKSADIMGSMIEKERDQIIRDILATESKELQMLIHLKFTDSLSWAEISAEMIRLYPTRKPPFTVDHLLKTFWPRSVGKHFRETLINTLKRHGYDFRRKR